MPGGDLRNLVLHQHSLAIAQRQLVAGDKAPLETNIEAAPRGALAGCALVRAVGAGDGQGDRPARVRRNAPGAKPVQGKLQARGGESQGYLVISRRASGGAVPLTRLVSGSTSTLSCGTVLNVLSAPYCSSIWSPGSSFDG
jgi:hypothetical protein